MCYSVRTTLKIIGQLPLQLIKEMKMHTISIHELEFSRYDLSVWLRIESVWLSIWCAGRTSFSMGGTKRKLHSELLGVSGRSNVVTPHNLMLML